MKWAVTDKLKKYLYGPRSFEVSTDNNPLTYVLTTAKLDATTKRSVAALALYNFEIYYRSGKHNIDADSLSRTKWPESVDDIVADKNSCIGVKTNIVHAIFQGTSIPYAYVETISKSTKVVPESYLGSMTLDKWKVEQSKDPSLHFLNQLLNEGVLLQRKTSQVELNCPGNRPYLKSQKQIQLHNGLLYKKVYSDKHRKQSYFLQLVLPPQLIDYVLKSCYDEVGHLGRDETLEPLTERFYWHSMYRDVVYNLSNCASCLTRKGIAPKAELCPITANRPLKSVHMDYLSLEPKKGKQKIF